MAAWTARWPAASWSRPALLLPALGWAVAPLAAASWAWLVPLALGALVLVALVPAAPARTAGSVLVLLLAAGDAARTQVAGALWVTVLALLLAGWLVLGERWPPSGREHVVELFGQVLLCASGAALVAAVAVAGPRGGLPLAVLGLLGGAVAYRLAGGRMGD